MKNYFMSYVTKLSNLTGILLWFMVWFIIWHYSHLTILNWKTWVIVAPIVVILAIHETLIGKDAVEKYKILNK